MSTSAESFQQPYVEDYDSVISEVVPLTRRGGATARGKSGLSNETTISESYDGVSDSGYSSTNTPLNETPPLKSTTPAPPAPPAPYAPTTATATTATSAAAASSSSSSSSSSRRDPYKRASTPGLPRPASKSFSRTSPQTVPRNIPGAKPRERSPIVPTTGGSDECDCSDCKKDVSSKASPSSLPSLLANGGGMGGASYQGSASYSQSPSWSGFPYRSGAGYDPAYDSGMTDSSRASESVKKRSSMPPPPLPPPRPSSTFSGASGSSYSTSYNNYFPPPSPSASHAPPTPASTCPPAAFSAYPPPPPPPPLNTNIPPSPGPTSGYSPYSLPPYPSYSHDASWSAIPPSPSYTAEYSSMPPPPPFMTAGSVGGSSSTSTSSSGGSSGGSSSGSSSSSGGGSNRRNSMRAQATAAAAALQLQDFDEYANYGPQPPSRRSARMGSGGERPPSWHQPSFLDGLDRSISVPPQASSAAHESSRRKQLSATPGPAPSRRRESNHSQPSSGQCSARLGPSALSRAMESCAISDDPHPVSRHARSHSDYYSSSPSSSSRHHAGQLTRRELGALTYAAPTSDPAPRSSHGHHRDHHNQHSHSHSHSHSHPHPHSASHHHPLPASHHHPLPPSHHHPLPSSHHHSQHPAGRDEMVRMSVPDSDGETFTMRYPAGLPVKLRLDGGPNKTIAFGHRDRNETLEPEYHSVQQRQQRVHAQLQYGALDHGSRKTIASEFPSRPSTYTRRTTMSGAI